MVIAGIGLGVIVLAWYVKNQAGRALTSAGEALASVAPYIDPTSDQNLAYTSVNSLLQLMGGTGSLGTMAYDYVHKTDIDPTTGTMPNYTKAQQDADYQAMLKLQNGYHGL